MGRLQDKVALVTGGTSGIGQRTVALFAAEGAKVVFTGRRAKLGEEVAAAIRAETGGEVRFVPGDMTVEAEVKGAVEAATGHYGRLDVLFNNAGAPAPGGGIEDIPWDGFQRAMDNLVGSVMLGMKHAAPVMRKQGAGSIINNGSVAASRAGYSSSIIYGAAKAAVVHLTKCVAMELGEEGVRVNAVSPGGIATGIFGKAAGMASEQAEGTAEPVRKALAGMQPIRRAGITDDIAYAALFLASDESTFVNAHELVVDGGLIAGRQWTPMQEGMKAMRSLFG
ncbi:SDR family NAD(P)-dependent oxidoreductase [Marinibaculum pumilum]|uniref:SDR family NAD(P)-dependent oxidoreductase n=1 Tax=Marinibaculum pumilum TaxID=1766165 RepID=A0ABV7KX63_9PROT